MDQIKDNIYDAYYSKMGEEFGKKVRERIHWITQNVKGTDILDVGCSQGITSILLGREGKNVLGLDVSTSAIEDAKKYLALEESDTQECVAFEKNNFFLKHFDKQYDTVILGEVLEHITDINTFFLKAVKLTKDEGRIIVTTPFGINDFIDHKRTFYLLDFLKMQGENIVIDEIKFFGKWIGIIYKKASSSINQIEIDNTLLQRFEDAVYKLEKGYLNQIHDLKKRQNVYKRKLDQAEKNTKNIEDRINENYVSKQEFLNEKTEKVKIQKELHDAYSQNESLIIKHKKLHQDYEKLLTRYYNLKNSKLGRLTTKYWNLRNKKRSN